MATAANVDWLFDALMYVAETTIISRHIACSGLKVNIVIRAKDMCQEVR